MKISFTKEKRDKWVRNHLKKNPNDVIASGDFLPLPIFIAVIVI